MELALRAASLRYNPGVKPNYHGRLENGSTPFVLNSPRAGIAANCATRQDQVAMQGDRTMKRRTFFRRLFGSLGAAATGAVIATETRSVLIQESSVAGFQFYKGDAIWSSLAVGEELALAREASNTHDPDAVAIYFHEDKLGYVPRSDARIEYATSIIKKLANADSGDILVVTAGQLQRAGGTNLVRVVTVE